MPDNKDSLQRPRGKRSLSPYAADQRFSYSVLAPRAPATGLLVAIHDSERDCDVMLEGFADMVETYGLALVVPLFPADVLGDGNADGYKVLHEGTLRYDALLNGMVTEVRKAMNISSRRLFIHGYSGGAQFVQRFVTLHPDEVTAAAIAAPGEVTLPDDEVPWWAGVADTMSIFGRKPDWRGLARVQLDLTVGELDTSTELLKRHPPSRYWDDDRHRLTANRQDRLKVLHDAWLEKGIAASFGLLAGAKHSDGQLPAIQRAIQHFCRVLVKSSA
jgi:hypothetical protein